MKIVCDSCGAKYSIADEKVAGRVFKIRCKKCGAAIVVRGNESAAAPQAEGAGGAAAAGFDYGSDAVWHVVVEGEQQGPLSPAQLGQMISAGTIGWDAYVWKEGFEDWKPAQDIEELVQQIMNPAQGGEAAGADPFADAPKPSAPPARASASADAGADLFAQSESASPFGGRGGHDDDVVSSSPGPRVSANQAMTGARNENSVLFSLSNLQALATGGGAPAAAAAVASPNRNSAAPRAGMAAGEGSGLIDIRALAGATGLGGGASPLSPAAAPAPVRVDDLLSIGTVTPGLSLGAPVIIPEKNDSGNAKALMIGGIAVSVSVIAAAAIVAVVFMNNQRDPATLPVAGATGVLAPTAVAPTVAAAPVAAPSAVAAPAAPSAPTAVTPVAAAPSSTASRSEDEDRRGGGGAARGRRPAGGDRAAAPAAAEAPRAAEAEAPTRRSAGSGSIDDLLNGALGQAGSGRQAAARPAAGGGGGDSALPEQPSRSEVQAALAGVQSQVSACGSGQHGMAMTSISVAGNTGRVSNVNVTGDFAGTPVGSCVARAVRAATFPRFSRPTFQINYPFRI